MRKILTALLLMGFSVSAYAENVLSNTDHIVTAVTQAITILGGTVGPGGTYVDQTCKSGYSTNTNPFSVPVDAAGCEFYNGSVMTTSTFVDPSTLITNSQNGSFTFYSNSSATPANHAPYSILNQSSTGYGLGYDQQNYSALEANDQIYMMAFCGGPRAGDYPPIAFSTILPSSSGIPNIPDGSLGCGYGTGIEFSMTPGYKGFATGSPSGTTEAMSGVYSVLKTNHPTWSYADIKAALRQNADSWSAGYASYHTSPLGFGYGNIDYDKANAVASNTVNCATALTGAGSGLCLQAPGMAVVNHQYYATITLYPFVTTRRAKEVVYIGGTWPAASTGNELTAAQIASAGGTKIIDDGGATGVQAFTYAPAATGSATFTVLTLDASGNGSRVETFSQISESFVVGTGCFQ